MQNRIKQLRQAAGMTQKTLAGMIGVKQNTLSYWENGAYDVDTVTLQKLADIFSCTVDYLLCRDNASTSVPPAKQLQLSPEEKQLILAWRQHPELHDAIFRLLDVSFDRSFAKNA